jgi:hypothetical protein
VTLVLSVATPAYALHVSDRLVSAGGKPFDPLANKTVVFRATDGLLAIGYTGIAFLDGLPTDTWIADELSEGAASTAGGFIALGSFRIRNLGFSLLRLCQKLRHKQFQDFGGEVVAVGWQWQQKRRYSRPRDVLWVLHSGPGALRWNQLVPRSIEAQRQVFRMVFTGDWPLGDEEWKRLLTQVGQAGPDWESVEALLVAGIRASSEVRPGTIGGNCMSVLVRPVGYPQALIRFSPITPRFGSAFDQQIELAYSPWLIAPDAILSPSVSVGGMSTEQGLLTFSMDFPSPPQGQRLKGALQSQKRPEN